MFKDSLNASNVHYEVIVRAAENDSRSLILLHIGMSLHSVSV